MVQWKGNIQESQAGEKAANLDSIKNLEVPNFFVLTKKEIGENLKTQNPQEILNTQLPEEIMDKIEDAYNDIGMSSEVRNASGQARNLVGGQRENQRVSIRTSTKGKADYKLNIGSSSLEKAVKEVIASHYKQNNSTPAIIFQKMIEPDQTGAVIQNYTEQHTLVETVEGLGHSLEEAITIPELHLVQNREVTQSRTPEKQVKITRNPMNGERRQRKITKNKNAFQKTEIKKLANKADHENLSLKFAYKRGTFYITDAFRNQPINTEPDLEALKVSNGEITGRQGKDYILTDQPRKTSQPQVSKKGGYTSTPAQHARKNQAPAVYSLKNTEKIQNNKRHNIKTSENLGKPKNNNEKQKNTQTDIESVTATKIKKIKQVSGLQQNPFNNTDQDKLAKTCEEILLENTEKIDARNIREKALQKTLKQTNNVQLLVIDEPTTEILYKIVENRVEAIAVPQEQLEKIRKELLRAEKRFILDNLSQLKN